MTDLDKLVSPKVTVITVVLNGVSEIETTLHSIAEQSYSNIELIVLDGGSIDGTVKIIESFNKEIDYWTSEKDAGIYDAMNKGISYSTGDWLCFMNAGDRFYDTDVLRSIFDTVCLEELDIIYGDHTVTYPNGKERDIVAGDVVNLWKGSQFCHQSVFVRTTFHVANPYKFDLRIASDYQFFYNAMKSGARFKKVNRKVSYISSGGLSDVERIESIKEMWSVVDRDMKTDTYYLCVLLIEYVKIAVKKLT
jgi:glycosyltransferase involved in cell wall biosynthesis